MTGKTMKNVHRIAGLKISRIAPTSFDDEEPLHGSELLPDLEPAEELLRRRRSSIFGSETISVNAGSLMDDPHEPIRTIERSDFTARFTVYVMNAIVMVFAMPVGAALLCLNILGGENIRTTAHALALVGMFMALGVAEGGALTNLL